MVRHKELARLVETEFRASSVNVLRRPVITPATRKLFRAAWLEGASVRPARAGDAVTHAGALSVCPGLLDRFEDWRSALASKRAARHGRQARRSNDAPPLFQKLELTSGGIDSGLIPMLSIDDV